MTNAHDTCRAGDLPDIAAAALRKIVDEQHDGPLALMKGAVQSVLESCDRILVGGQAEELSEARKEEVRRADDRMASDGKRVLGMAYRLLDPAIGLSHPEVGQVEREFVFLGLAGMIDPPRAEAKQAVARCRSAGLRPVMITGDHPHTAGFIARELGIMDEGEPVTGRDLQASAEGDGKDSLRDVVAGTQVFARVAPEHKLSIVEALQEAGEVVAMTGDGVNDAPALKKADIGVAMGITGTDVSKEAAEMVLLDDDFASIVDAVEEGRTIYDNIRKFLKYTLTSNFGEIWVMLAAPLIGMPLPLVPLQILWINLVTDVLPGLAMAVEPAERDIMSRAPRPPGERILNREMIRDILIFGTLMGSVALGLGYLYWSDTRDVAYDASWGTIIFTVLTLSQMGNALAIRSSRDSVFRIGVFSNRALVAAISVTVLLQLAVIYVPFLQRIFKTSPLSATDLLICVIASTVVFWAVELSKRVTARRA